MSGLIKSVRGMNDWEQKSSYRLQQIERQAVATFSQANYAQVRLPVLEKTELFARAVGSVTDIVEKEMYSFTDRNDDKLSLRPEGTAGLVRAIIQNGWWQAGQTVRYQYLGPMFRRERPQKGRYRQFTQFGAEVFGSFQPIVDGELILLSARWFERVGLSDYISLQINTIGKSEDRKKYREALVNYLTPLQNDLDEDSKNRLSSNPLRILDSKIESTQALLMEAPKLQDFLCVESERHFSEVLAILNQVGINYTINNRLVRGLDYYNDTVFEWVTENLGSQGTVCGGGRYDGLVQELGGKNCPACGFAAGLERIELLYHSIYGDESDDNNPLSEKAIDVYVVCQQSLSGVVLSMVDKVRRELTHLRIVCDGQLGSFKSQFRRADKSGAKVALVIAEREYGNKDLIIKPLRNNGEQSVIPLSDVSKILQSFFK